MCWPSPKVTRSPPACAPAAPTSSPPACRRVPGSACLPGQAPKATAATTGLGGHRPRPARPPLAAGPPQPADQGTCVLPLLLPPPHPPGHPGQSRRAAVDGGEHFQASKGLAGLDEHQVRRWASWCRWITLAMLATAFLTIADASEHTPQPGTGRADPADPQRNRRAVRHRAHPARARCPAPPAMVHLATAPPAPRQNLPLPAASQATVKIAKSGWSTSEAPPRTAKSVT
jgi:hypothetical protein